MPADKKKNIFKRIFDKYFGFESGIDIADEVALLSRRNYVIKNIVAISNTFYTILFLVISLIEPNTATNWIFTVVSVALTIGVNYLLGKLAKDKDDLTKQKVAMYVSAAYIFVSAVLVYAKVNTAQVDMETAGYVLILYSLVVISLYQDKKMLLNSFLLLFIGITVIHLTMTHDIGQEFPTVGNFFNSFFSSPQFADVVLRTIIFIAFYFVVYIIVSISQYMQEERKKELVKRRQIQTDFYNIVSNLFTVVFSASHNLMEEKHAKQVAYMADYIAKDYGLTGADIAALKSYELIHLEYDKIKDFVILDSKETDNESDYDKLKDKTELGARIAERLQLAQKCEDIARAHVEGTNNKEFMEDMNRIQPAIIAQIILISDLYITMRNATTYKRPMPHKSVISLFQGELSYYFDYNLKEKFLRFNSDFERIYNSFE